MQSQTLPSPYLSRSYVPYSQQYDIDDIFSLVITQRKWSTKIIMMLRYQHLYTQHIPTIVELLKQQLPAVLETACYNDSKLPFHIEVKNTEIGHLFEHILLEYLCQYKIAKGAIKATYAGKTKWNWYKDPKGKFHIHLNCGVKDADILPQALDKTISLMRIILAHEHNPRFVELAEAQQNGLKNGEHTQKPTTS